MPIPAMVSGGIISTSSSKTPQMVQIATAVELGLYQWLSLCSVVGAGVGVVGAGQVVGTVTVIPNAPLMEGAFKSNGLLGVFAPVFWTPIILGISKPYPFTGLSPTVGSGVVTGVFVGDPLLLSQFLLSSFTLLGMIGLERVRLCTALAQGIYAHFQLGQVLGSIVGPSGPSPSTSQVIGKFI